MAVRQILVGRCWAGSVMRLWGWWLILGCQIMVSPVYSDEIRAWRPEILDKNVYLPDYSYAGYRWGEETYPHPSHVLDIRKFGGAAGGDVTSALKKALDAAGSLSGHVTIHFPPGIYGISEIIYIEQGAITIRGSGSNSGGTEFSIRHPLRTFNPSREILQIVEYLKRIGKEEYSPYSWAGGYFWSRHPNGRDFSFLTYVNEGARGEHSFSITDPAKLYIGQTVRLRWFARDGNESSLLRHVYEMEGVVLGEHIWAEREKPLIVQDVTITEIEGQRIFIKEPLLHDVSSEYGSDLVSGRYLENVGFEGFSVVFPDVPYQGHHAEGGYNAFYINDVRHGWIKDVRVHNSDSAILTEHTSAFTVDGVKVTGRNNHYAIHLGDVHHVLVKNFDILTDSLHTVSFNTKSRASVFTAGHIYRPRLDQHRGINHQNLFDDLDVMEDRAVSELLHHGGARYWGPVHGAYNTFWNIRVTYSQKETFGAQVTQRKIQDGSNVRIVGLSANIPIKLNYQPDAYIEGLNRSGISVASLYRYQLEKRLEGAQIFYDQD